MPGLEKDVLNNNETGARNKKISVTVHRKGRPADNDKNTEPFAIPNIAKEEKDTLEINALQNTSIQNNISSIFGIIKDIRGLPVMDAVVQLKTLRNGSYTAINEVQSNSKGEYLFVNLPIGIYSLTIYKDGFINYQSTNISITFKESIGLNLCLQEDLRNHLGSIHGIISDESTNLPLENILVALYSIINNSELLISSTFTNIEGQYAFSLIPPGNYIIKAAAFKKEET